METGSPEGAKMSAFIADRTELERFIQTVFRHADPGTYVSLRSFLDGGNTGTWKYDGWTAIEINGDMSRLLDAAEAFATRCASADESVVFCPPVATFKNALSAAAADIANGLTISVELDAHPAKSRQIIEEILGPATIVVASGGIWINPEVGKIEDKLHLHWLLDHPTRQAVEFDFLTEIRKKAATLIGSDPTSITAVHPMRWPGSWHLKAAPRLARTIEFRPEIEISLAAALEKVRKALERAPEIFQASGLAPRPLGPVNETELEQAIITGATYHAACTSLVGRWAQHGVPFLDAQKRLHDLFDNVPPQARDNRWRARRQDVPKIVRDIYGAEARRRDDRETRAEEGLSELDGRSPPPPGIAADTAEAPNGRKYRFPLTAFRDITLDTEAVCIVEDLIPREGIVVLWGPPKSGKSFFVFDLLMHVSLGWEYRGRRVEQGIVVYVVAEGERGIKARAEAFRQKRLAEQSDADPPFYVLPTRLDLVGDIDELVSDIKAQLPAPKTCAAIVVDTLNRTLRGSESKDEDMSAYRDAADRLREDFRAAVVIVHHCGIDGTRPRGHTSLTGAADAQLSTQRNDDNLVVVKLEYMKDGPEGAVLTSKLVPVDVGIDDHGKPISSCVVEPVGVVSGEAAKRSAGKLSPNDKIALQALDRALATASEPAPTHNHIPTKATVVKASIWQIHYLEASKSSGEDLGTIKRTWRRARERLLSDKFIGAYGELVWKI
jgi:AAA domain-containing protein